MYTLNEDRPSHEVGPGTTRKVLSYSPNLMVCELHLQKGAVGPIHRHPQEQITYVVSGKLRYQEEGQPDQILGAGDSYVVGPNVAHGGVAEEPTVMLDIFTPMREDLLKELKP